MNYQKEIESSARIGYQVTETADTEDNNMIFKSESCQYQF